ncbi:MAG: DUF4097 family beta strand repeat-containing protein [Acidobacteria bacterium]|nr:DUF4097 family beta strand repeat-containing protein [Acidobacteriota bacterium]
MTNQPSIPAPDAKTPISHGGPLLARGGMAVASLVAATLLSAPAFGEFDESHRFNARSLEVTNLIGKVVIGSAAGDEFEVEVSVRGADGVRRNINVEQERGSRARLDVVFPVEDERRFVYPEFSRRRAQLWFRQGRSSSLLGEILRAVSGRRIRVQRSGSGMEVWADLTIRVPEGASLKLEHGAGDVEIEAIAANLDVDVKAGAMEAAGLDGRIELGVGSGRLAVHDARGELELDTGSGGISLEDFEGGDLVIDTGSGTVEVARADAESIDVDTGSGGVRLHAVEAERLVVDTGSGGVGVESAAIGAASIDTGSGSVRLALVRMGDGEFDIDTGSGGISLLVPADVSARFDIDVGAGGIDVDVPIARTLHKSRGEMRFIAGDGKASVILDTGAGSVRVATVD